MACFTPVTPIKNLIPEELIPDAIKGIIPGAFNEDSDNTIYYSSISHTVTKDKITSTITLLFPEAETSIDLPGLEGFQIVFSVCDDLIPVSLTLYPAFKLVFSGLTVALRFPRDMMRPVKDNSRDLADGFTELSLTGRFEVTWDGGLQIDFDASEGIKLNRSLIGNTGIIVSASGVRVRLKGDEWGLYFDEASLELPSNIDIRNLPTEFTITACSITKRGFTGTLSAEWPVAITTSGMSGQKTVIDETTSETIVTLFAESEDQSSDSSFRMAVKTIGVRLEDNRLTDFSIRGIFQFPDGVFDKVVSAELSLNDKGDLIVGLQALEELDHGGSVGGTQDEQGLLTLTKDNLFDLTVKAFQFRRTAEETAFTVDCDLQFTNASVKQIIPKLGLQGFTVYLPRGDSTPRFRLEGGKVGINRSFDFNKFRVDITEIGIAKEKMTFSGSILLLEGIDESGVFLQDLGIPLTMSGGLSLGGVGLLIVTKTFEFIGEIAYEDSDNTKAFRGGISLIITPIGMGIESQILVGKSRCGFAYLYSKIILPPPGFQLGSLPLYLRTIDGLIGVNVSLNADETHEFFPLSERSPKGITHSSKWRDKCGANAIGLGIGVSTATDRLLNMSGLLVVTFPELMLLIEGKAFILEKPSLGKDPPFNMLMAFDPETPAALLNVSAEYEFIKGVVEAMGVVEAYYGPDPENPGKTIWYYSMGQVRPYFPVDKPVSAKVLIIFGAAGYLIVKPGLWVLGAQIGMPGINFDFRIISVIFHALIKGFTELKWDPEQVKGSLELDGAVGFRIFRRGFNIALFASVLGMAPDWLVEAVLRFGVSFKILWKRVKIEAEIPFRWEKRVIPPIPDVFEQAKLIHAVETRTWDPGEDPSYESIPNVEPDSMPLISFRFPIKDNTGLPFGQDVHLSYPHRSGDYTFDAEIPQGGIQMWRCLIDKFSEPDSWEEFKNPLQEGDPKVGPGPFLYGAWLADEDPDGVIYTTHLQLFARTPFEFDRNRVLRRAETVRMFGRESPPVQEQPASGSSGLSMGPAATGQFPALQPVAQVRKPITRIKYDHIPKPYPLRSANFVTREAPEYPFTGRGLTTRHLSFNFLRSGVKEYPRSQILDLGPVQIGSTKGFRIKEDTDLLSPLRFLEVVADSKNPAQVLLSFKDPIERLEINYISGMDGKKTAPPNINAAYKRQSPEKGPWNFDQRVKVPLIVHQESDGRITVQADRRKADSKIPRNFDLIQLLISGSFRILSLSCVFDTSEELARRTAQLEGFIDVTMRQRPDPGSVKDTAEKCLGGEPGTASRPGGPFTRAGLAVGGIAAYYPMGQYAVISRPNADGPIIPGYVYKMKIATSVSRQNGGERTGRRDERTVFFKVENPPSTLKPYVLTTFPREAGYPHYGTHEFFVRFLKNYVHKLFPQGYGCLTWNLSGDSGWHRDLEYSDVLSSGLDQFYDDTTEIREGWRWGAAPDHTLTKEESILLETYNRNCPEGNLNERMILGDDMMWIYTVNPVLMRATFDTSLVPFEGVLGSDGPSNTIDSILWSTGTGILNKKASDGTEQESFLLSRGAFDTDIILSVWIRPNGSSTEMSRKTGFILLWESGNRPYLKLSLDLNTKRVSLIKVGEPSFMIDKGCDIAKNRWTKLQLRVKREPSDSGSNDISVTFLKGDQIVFSELLKDDNLRNLPDTGKVGLFASRGYDGSYDNFEVLSISRLNRIPQVGSNHTLSLKWNDNELYQFRFIASRYLDLFDHMNSWDRAVWTLPQGNVSDYATPLAQWKTLRGNLQDVPADGTLLQLMGQLLADEENLILDMLTKADIEKTTEAQIDSTKKALKDVQYELDQHFQTIGESLGFDLVSRTEKFEVTLSKDKYALFLQSPEPINWTRICTSQTITQHNGDGSTLNFDTEIIHSSDMTRAIVFLKSNGSESKFDGEFYTWDVYLNYIIPDYLDWIRPWLETRGEHYQLGLEVKSEA